MPRRDVVYVDFTVSVEPVRGLSTWVSAPFVAFKVFLTLSVFLLCDHGFAGDVRLCGDRFLFFVTQEGRRVSTCSCVPVFCTGETVCVCVENTRVVGSIFRDENVLPLSHK